MFYTKTLTLYFLCQKEDRSKQKNKNNFFLNTCYSVKTYKHFYNSKLN